MFARRKSFVIFFRSVENYLFSLTSLHVQSLGNLILNLKNGSMDFFNKTFTAHAYRCKKFYIKVLLTLIHFNP